ncbi:ParA family protein [Agrobacterium larrymoorei]|uniref:Chromosome partitioning protein n=1 Tax=Agrobacterium larrymoorei TaxID=160699 RepID=A0ABU0UF83_9HYPH|nr:AAA family ATPase [Agrobacterium larrymoorei]MDQ1183600.1 chromosome partitioning protein [Agrobacterium larrymoorei]
MTKRISIFNNKGGVGKTTYMYHVSHLLARKGLTVLMVDCDSQCNLTSYAMADGVIRRAWSDTGNSIYQNILPVYRTTGDIRERAPTKVSQSYDLFLVPGDLRLSNFEDLLGDTWSSARGGQESALRAQSAIHRYIEFAADKIGADLVLIDLGPNLGALNRAVLASSDYFIMPVAPDLFSIQGTENLGNKLVSWRKEWDQCNGSSQVADISIPRGAPSYLGYVVQMHNQRADGVSSMTAGWRIYGQRLEPAIRENIVNKLNPIDQVVVWEDEGYKLGQIPNLHSLIPYSLKARKPVFDCTYSDGLRGEHIARAAQSDRHFREIVATLQQVATW